MNAEVQLIATHFGKALPPMKNVAEEFICLKLKILEEVRAGNLADPQLLSGPLSL